MTRATRGAPAVSAVVSAVARRFALRGLDTPLADARALVGGLLDLDLTALVLRPDRPVSAAERARIQAAAERRCAGEPVHRILGRRAFYGFDLVISPATLEPRADTETLIDTVLPLARRMAAGTDGLRILDLGTGSGAIVLAVLAALDGATAVATDLSVEALAVAGENAARLGLSNRLDLVESDWFDRVDGRFDLILSNPPYIPSADIAGLAPEVRDFDPPMALDGGEDGLSAYRAIARGAAGHLQPDGLVAVETGYDQHAAVTALFSQRGFDRHDRAKDLGGRDRVLVFRPVR